MAKPVSQSRTMWVKKGDVVGGKKVKKGYVAQYGRPEKRVTARIKLEEATRRGKAGDVAVYKSGRYKKTVGKGRVDRSKTTAGGGVTKAQAAAARRNADRPAAPTPPPAPETTRTGFSSSAANRGGYSAAGYIRRLKPTAGGVAGSGRDNVNAASSAGSAKVSSATDSLFTMPRGTQWGGERPTPEASNRPSSFRGRKTQLKRSPSGLRWVKVGK
jgi:hypothetical protein